MADYEEHGRFYIEKTQIADPDGRVFEFYEVGQVVVIDGVKRLKPSSDYSAKSRDDALAWIKAQG